MTIDELRPYSGFRVAVTMNSGLVHPGVLYVKDGEVRILQPIPPQFQVLDPENVATIDHRDDVGWPVTNASPEQTEAAATLLRPHLEQRARLTFNGGSTQIGVVSLSAEHGWVLLPGTVKGSSEGKVIALADLLQVSPA
jgi:hypothetical protein